MQNGVGEVRRELINVGVGRNLDKRSPSLITRGADRVHDVTQRLLGDFSVFSGGRNGSVGIGETKPHTPEVDGMNRIHQVGMHDSVITDIGARRGGNRDPSRITAISGSRQRRRGQDHRPREGRLSLRGRPQSF